MPYLALFKMPKTIKITGRSSSITNAFVNAIIPVIKPTESQVVKAFSILRMTAETFQCSYCGNAASEWDHLRPLIIDKRPTGYVSEIHNLVPSCGKCNQSKGNKNWHEWMLGPAKLSPATRGISDIQDRIGRLKEYEQWAPPTKIDFEKIVGAKLWTKHMENLEGVQNLMRDSQVLAEQIRSDVANQYQLSELE
jgi:hypothetical protein